MFVQLFLLLIDVVSFLHPYLSIYDTQHRHMFCIFWSSSKCASHGKKLIIDETSQLIRYFLIKQQMIKCSQDQFKLIYLFIYHKAAKADSGLYNDKNGIFGTETIAKLAWLVVKEIKWLSQLHIQLWAVSIRLNGEKKKRKKLGHNQVDNFMVFRLFERFNPIFCCFFFQMLLERAGAILYLNRREKSSTDEI